MLPHLRLLLEKEDAAKQEIQKPEFKARVLAASEGLTRMVLANPESETILEAKLDCLRILKELEQKSSEQKEEWDFVKKTYRDIEKYQKINPDALLRVKPRKSSENSLKVGNHAPDAPDALLNLDEETENDIQELVSMIMDGSINPFCGVHQGAGARSQQTSFFLPFMGNQMYEDFMAEKRLKRLEKFEKMGLEAKNEQMNVELGESSKSDPAQEVSKKNVNYEARFTRLMKVLAQCPGEMKRASGNLDNVPAPGAHSSEKNPYTHVFCPHLQHLQKWVGEEETEATTSTSNF